MTWEIGWGIRLIVAGTGFSLAFWQAFHQATGQIDWWDILLRSFGGLGIALVLIFIFNLIRAPAVMHAEQAARIRELEGQLESEHTKEEFETDLKALLVRIAQLRDKAETLPLDMGLDELWEEGQTWIADLHQVFDKNARSVRGRSITSPIDRPLLDFGTRQRNLYDQCKENLKRFIDEEF